MIHHPLFTYLESTAMKTPLFSRLLGPVSLAIALMAATTAHAQQKLQIAGNFAVEHPSSVAV